MLGYAGLGLGLAGAAGAYGALDDVSTISSPSLKKSFYAPNLLQLLALGTQPTPLTKSQKKKLGKHEKVKLFGQTFAASDLGADALQKAALGQQQAQVELQQKSFEALKGSPLFESLFADANEVNPGNLQTSLLPALSQLANNALGGAAQGGLNVNDPLVQAKVLGPLALQGTLAQNQVQLQNKALQSQAGANLAAALTGQGSAVGQSAAQGIPFFTNSFFNQQNLKQQAQAFNAQAQNQATGAQAGLLAGLGGFGLGGGLQGLFG